MAHTLNEQVLVIPAGDGEQNFETLLTFLTTNAGLTRVGNILYADSEHKYGIRFDYSSATSVRVDVLFNGSHTMTSPGHTYNPSSETTVRAHVSAQETVKYVKLSNYPIVFAKSNDGGMTIFTGYNASGSISGAYFGNDTTTESSASITMAQIKNSSGISIGHYTISRMPDFWHDTLFDELYEVRTTASSKMYNQLVSFNGSVYRLIFMGPDTTYSAFAMPVSEGSV